MPTLPLPLPPLGRLVARAYRAAHLHIAEGLRGTGVGYGQFPFLNYVGRNDGTCQERMAHDLLFDKGTTARAMATLEGRGLVTREVCATDKRKYRVFVTERGRAVLVRLQEVLAGWEAALTKGFSADEVERTRDLLEKLAKNGLAAVRDGRREKQGDS